MAVPVITEVQEVTGPSGGGELVYIVGTDFAESVEVDFGDSAAEVIRVRPSGTDTVADVITPAHSPGVVAVTVRNLDTNGDPVPGEEATELRAYTFSRYNLVRESALARLLRALLTDLKRSVLANTGISVSVDFDMGGDDLTRRGAHFYEVDTAQLPSLTLTGLELPENRDASDNVIREIQSTGPSGTEYREIREPFVVDVELDVLGATNHTLQFANLLQWTTAHFHRYRWVSIDRDPDDASAGVVEFEIDPVGTPRSGLAGGKDNLRTFIRPIRVRGFWLDAEDLLALNESVEVLTTEVHSTPITP